MNKGRRFSARRRSADIFGAIGHFHRLDVPQQASQPVQLIKQVQNDRDAFVVHAEIYPKILDQLRPREVGF